MHIRLRIQEKLHGCRMTGTNCIKERSFAVRIGLIDICSCSQQFAGTLRESRLGSPMKRRFPFGVLDVDGGSGRQQLPYAIWIVRLVVVSPTRVHEGWKAHPIGGVDIYRMTVAQGKFF